MLVEFMRTVERNDEDGFGLPLPISILPINVGAVFPHAETRGVTVIRLADGRGFSVRDPYNDVVAKINAALDGKAPPKSKSRKADNLPAIADQSQSPVETAVTE